MVTEHWLGWEYMSMLSTFLAFSFFFFSFLFFLLFMNDVLTSWSKDSKDWSSSTLYLCTSHTMIQSFGPCIPSFTSHCCERMICLPYPNSTFLSSSPQLNNYSQKIDHKPFRYLLRWIQKYYFYLMPKELLQLYTAMDFYFEFLKCII